MFDAVNPLSSFSGIPHTPMNGMSAMIAQSELNRQNLIRDFENAIANGYDPYDVSAKIFAARGLSEQDLTEFDRRLLEKRVEAIYKSKNNMRR